MNPAIDRTLTVDRLAFEDRAYILSSAESAGGRGINASAAIGNFGGRTRAIVTCGGESCAKFRKLLDKSKFPVEIVTVQSETRTNFTVSDGSGLTVKLNEKGAAMTAEEIARVEKAIRARLEGVRWLMICGSLPPGVPPEFYARLIETARKKKIKTLLDTDGDALREGIKAKPSVATPNQHEAERLLNTVLLTRNHSLDAARQIHKLGAQAVVLSLGARGAIGVHGQQTLEAIPPQIDAVCAIGAGDAMAAAFTWAMDKQKTFADALRWGVAAGTASAKLPGVAIPTMEQSAEVYEKVEIRKVS